MTNRFSFRSALGGLSVILMGALSAAPVAAQMASPDRPVQRSTMSAADLEQIAATARPRQPTRMIEPAAATATAMVAPAESGEAPRVTAGHAGVPVRTMVDEREYRAMVAAAESARDGAVSTQAEGISTQNYGLNFQDTLYHYSDRLVSPRPYYAPERSTGLLLFQASDSNWYICTATLIQRAIILTAGHCVYEGGTGDDTGWNLQGYFIPAYSASDGSATGTNQPYGRCDIDRWFTTSDWYNTGALNGGYDVGLATCGRLHDARWAANNNKFPGGRVGYLGFCYQNCRWNYQFLTQLGYPSNYYAAGEMTVSQHLEVTGQPDPYNPSWVGLDYIFGSGMRGGSSGGPHIANLGEIVDSATNPGQFPDRNTIFAVTSWGYGLGNSSGTEIKIQGASPLSGVANANNFIDLFNMACRRSRNHFGTWTCDLLPV